ncbi:MAG: hypothetical protein MUC58_01715 [Rhizobiaceae bacterium]|nr:hypothetical protein [Rhizobiaceae bacterium]
MPSNAIENGLSVSGVAGTLTVEADAIPLNTLMDRVAAHLGIEVSGPTVDGTAITVRMSGPFSQIVARLMGRRGYAVAYENGEPRRLIMLPVAQAAPVDPFAAPQADPMDGGMPIEGEPFMNDPAGGMPDGSGMVPPPPAAPDQGMTDEQFLLQQQMEQEMLMQGVQPDQDALRDPGAPFAPKP